MKSLSISGPIGIGIVLLLYIFTFGEIWNNHSVQSYLVLCAGVLSIDIGLLAIGLTKDRR
jgi:hypothetical protein